MRQSFTPLESLAIYGGDDTSKADRYLTRWHGAYYLENILGVKPGEILTVEVLEGSKPLGQVPVAGLVKQYIGLMGYMDLFALNRLMKEDHTVSGAYLSLGLHFFKSFIILRKGWS